MNQEIERQKEIPDHSIVSSRIRWNPLRVGFKDEAGFHSGPRSKRSRLQHALWSWFSSVIDILILISLSSLLLLSFSFIFQQQPEAIWLKVLASQTAASLVTQAFLVTAWIYFITTRFFLGASVGEWTCQIQLGTAQQQALRPKYLLKVVVRETLMVSTGLLLLPLLSLLIAKDFIGEVLDLKLYSLK